MCVALCVPDNCRPVLWGTGVMPGPAGSAAQASSRDAVTRVEDRLTALEADLSHSTAANEAMSGIIDQV